ncbi:lactonase family protein [Glaciibacter sp. 2TAF33]|uniref:lactonase family protein n=1 Tax=Glaciibacter sp. 2TAF33 TaxID=3233015 RepID=UPI003F8E2BB9
MTVVAGVTDASARTRLWCGTYTPPAGTGRGIESLAADGEGHITGSSRAATADSPSFLAAHPSLDLVYAVAEHQQTVQGYRVIGRDRLEPVGDPWPAGEAACHVAADPGGRFLVVACWGSGEVLLYDLGADGAIVARHEAAAAVDPYPDGPAGATRVSRAHSSAMLPDGRVLTTDLGFDLLRVWEYAPGRGLVADGDVPLGAGSGPRHVALHPGGFVYVVTEYSIEVVILAADAAGRLTVVGRTPATAAGPRPGDAAAEISLDPAGRFLYVSVRGSNVISTLAVLDDGARLVPVGDVPCGGDWPRHHLQRGELLHVANERSSSVTTFRIDASTGVPAELVDTARVGSPTCLLPA